LGRRLTAEILKGCVQYYVLAQSPPGRGPNDKYPVNSFTAPDLCKNVSLQCYFVVAVISIQSVRNQIYVLIYTYIHTHTHILHKIEKLVGQKIRTVVNAAFRGNSFTIPELDFKRLKD